MAGHRYPGRWYGPFTPTVDPGTRPLLDLGSIELRLLVHDQITGLVAATWAASWHPRPWQRGRRRWHWGRSSTAAETVAGLLGLTTPAVFAEIQQVVTRHNNLNVEVITDRLVYIAQARPSDDVIQRDKALAEGELT